MDQEPQPLSERVQALAEALDNLDTSDRTARREIAAVIRWAREGMERDKARRADILRNAVVVIFSICATVIGGLILSKLK